MRPHLVPSPANDESDLFRNRLDSLIDMRHEFVRLSGLIDWKRFDEAFGELYAEKGRPGLPTRLMVGLHLIKHARGLSDEQVCAQWLENAYFQYFSGETYFQTALPLDRTSMSVWRGRIGPEKLEALIAETLAAARRAGAVEPSQMRRLTIDTTAQTKAVAHPTDSHLLLRAIEWLNRTAKKQGVAVRQSYLRVARHARREVGRLMHAGQRKQAERWVRKLRTWTGRLTRDIERKTVGDRKSTRLNSSHLYISYAVFCLKKNDEPRLRMRHQRFARRSARPGEKAHHFARHSRFVKNIDENCRNRRRIARRLHDRRVSCHDRRYRHPAHDRRRKIPRRNNHAHAQRNVLHEIFLAAHWRQLLRLAQTHHFAPVVFAEINQLRDIGI